VRRFGAEVNLSHRRGDLVRWPRRRGGL